ncbi:MAG TPA: hypothetical protein VMT62_14070 [Syntrophorhabdaceae bacterium]|nr:hypothetical protein [Syntrophorhabdaceae bacterium]
MITGIGSFPFTSVDEAIDLIFDTCSQIPFWPQLPQRSPLENMYTTFLEGVPCLVADEKRNTTFMHTEHVDGIEKFYEDVANDNIEAFRITEKVAPGFYRFLDRLEEIRTGVKYIKCQLTGPFSLGLGLKDERDKPIIYNNAFYDIIKKAIRLKARWMLKMLKAAYPEKEIIIFFDEPYMVSFGSSYVSVSRQEATSIFNEVLQGLEAKRGVHVCGNTDWSVLLNADVDMINYDAYGYLDTIFFYAEDLGRYLAKGGLIAPGIVPSSEQVIDTSLDDVLKLRSAFIREMGKVSREAASRDHIFTTSCGVGSLTKEAATRAMMLLKELG